MTTRLYRVSVMAAVVIGTLLALRSAPFLKDDAYIFLRYADNLASGRGPVFNPGGEIVEGFSSPMWLGMVTGLRLMVGRQGLETATSTLGLAVFILSMLAISRLSRLPQEGDDDTGFLYFMRLVPPLFLACLPTTASYMLSGLEPFLLLFAVLLFTGVADDAVPLAVGGVVGLLAMWIRPEGMWFSISYAAALIGRGEGRRLVSGRSLFLFGALAAGTVILTGLRYSIFGLPLPNTYYAKAPSLAAGLLYVGSTLTTPWGASILVLGLLGAGFGCRRHLGYLAAGLSWLVAAIVEGGDWMGSGRFLLPANAFFLLAVPGLAGVTESSFFEKIGFPRRWRLCGVLALLLPALALSGRAAWEAGNLARNNARYVSRSNAILAKWLTEARIRSLGTVDIGQIGFKSDLDIVDFGGLTDRTLARVSGAHLKKRIDLDYVLTARSPEVIAIRIQRPPTVHPNGSMEIDPTSAATLVEGEIWLSPLFRENYSLLFVNVPNRRMTPFYAQVFYLKRGIRIDAALMPTRKIIYHDWAAATDDD